MICDIIILCVCVCSFSNLLNRIKEPTMENALSTVLTLATM